MPLDDFKQGQHHSSLLTGILPTEGFAINKGTVMPTFINIIYSIATLCNKLIFLYLKPGAANVVPMYTKLHKIIMDKKLTKYTKI